MFSGIVETTSQLIGYDPQQTNVVVKLSRPSSFDDIKVGDSIAVNGICLTVDDFNNESVQFVLAAETMKVTKWESSQVLDRSFNLERSMKLSDRNHGHVVNGHVDEMGQVVEAYYEGESFHLQISFSSQLKPYLWTKGSVAINGVSLTINTVEGTMFNVCLVPETLRRTNLKDLKVGELVCLEADNVARGIVHNLAQLESVIRGKK